MSDPMDASTFVTPTAVVTALVGFLAGGASMAFNPFFAVSLIALVLCLVALRRAAPVRHYAVQGMLRIFAVIGIMGAVGGVAVLLWPGLGVGSYY